MTEQEIPGFVEPAWVRREVGNRLLGCSRSTTYSWIRAGELEAREFGHLTMLSLGSIRKVQSKMPAAKIRGNSAA